MRLAIFDLDYTIWRPEMYQLYGPPTLTSISSIRQQSNNKQQRITDAILKEARTNQDGMVLMDRRGSLMRVFDGASASLLDIRRLRNDGYDIRAAIASCTDEPSWARICLKYLSIDNDDDVGSKSSSSLDDSFETDLIEISKGDKTHHIRRLHKKTGIPFDQMAFFDNEYYNIESVSRSLPDVKCYYTPEGMTRQAWDEAKVAFGMS